MKTAEEILKNHLDKESIDSLYENIWPDTIEAMEKYAAQFMSVAPEIIKQTCVLFAGDMVNKALNNKMCTSNMLYLRMEKEYDKWKENTSKNNHQK